MNDDDKRRVLANHLAQFRAWTYDALAAAIDQTRRQHDCLRHVEGVFHDGTVFRIEVNVFWDDKAGGDIRVCGDITTEPQRPVIGLLPVYTCDAADSFIMARSGTIVADENPRDA